MNKQIQSLMQKEMTRKEFLATIGFGVASIFGFASVLKLLTGKKQEANGGYGSSAYGG